MAMDLDTAHQLLGTRPGMSESERMAAYQGQRQILDDKLVKAPVQALKEHFRQALARLDEALTVVEIAAAEEALPVMRSTSKSLDAVPPAPVATPAATPVAAPAPTARADPAPAPPAAPAPVKSALAAAPPSSFLPPSPVPAPQRPVPAAYSVRSVVAVAVIAAIIGGGGVYAVKQIRLQQRIAAVTAAEAPLIDGLHQVDAVVAASQAHARDLAARGAAADAALKPFYAEAAATWNDYLTWLIAASAAHPGRVALSQCQDLLHQSKPIPALDRLDDGLSSLTAWFQQRELEQERRHDRALWSWCVDRLRAGDRAPLAAYHHLSYVGDAWADLHGHLLTIDRIATPPADAADGVDIASATVGADDPDVLRWTAKLKSIADLSAAIDPAKRTGDLTGPAADIVETKTGQYELLVGRDDALAKAARVDVAAARAKIAALRATLAVLDDTAHPAAVSAALTLDATADSLAKLVAPDDAALLRWRGALRLLIAENRFRTAVADKDVVEARKLLTQAAAAGHVAAGARMVQLGMWDEIGTIDPRQATIAAWVPASWTTGATAAATAPATATASAITPPAIAPALVLAEFRANWAVRHQGDAPTDWQPMMSAARDALRDGLANAPDAAIEPILLSEWYWLCNDVVPPDGDHAASSLARLGAVLTPDSLAAMTDRLRAAAAAHAFATALRTAGRPNDAVDWFERAAAIAGAANDPRLQATSLLGAGYALQPDVNPAGSWTRAAALFAESARVSGAAGDIAAQASALFAQGEALRNDGNSWVGAEAAYAASADRFAAAKAPLDQGRALHQQAWCVQPDHDSAGSWAAAGALYAQAAKIRDADPAGAGDSLHAQGMTVEPDVNKDGNWQSAAALFAQAAEKRGIANNPGLQGISLFQQAWCTMPGNNPGGSWPRATALFAQSAKLRQAAGDAAGAGGSLFFQAYSLEPDNNPDGAWDQALALYAQSAAACAAGADIANQARAVYQQGWCQEPTNNPGGAWDAAIGLYTQAAQLYNQVKNDARAGMAFSRKGQCQQPGNNTAGSWDAAAASFAAAAAAYLAAGDDLNQAENLFNQGFCLQPSNNPNGDWTQAAELFTTAAELYHQAGKPGLEAVARYHVGWCREADNDTKTGAWDAAIAAFTSSASMAAVAGDHKQEGLALHQEGHCVEPDVDPQLGNWGTAASLFAQAADAYGAAGDKSSQGHCLHQQGWCVEPDHDSTGTWAAAIDLYTQAETLSDGPNQGSSYFQHGWCLQPDNNPQGSWDDAAALYAKAAAVFDQTGHAAELGRALFQQAWCRQPDHNPAGGFPEAAGFYAQSAQAYAKAGDDADADQGHSLAQQAWCLMKAGSWDDAASAYGAAAKLYEAAGNKKMQGNCLHEQAWCMIKGDPVNLNDAAKAVFAQAGQVLRAAGNDDEAKRADTWTQ
jgi:hypothetical protein